MLTPNLFSLFCAILPCLPLALVFTITSDSTTLSFSHAQVVVIPHPPSSPPSPRKFFINHPRSLPEISTSPITTTISPPLPPKVITKPSKTIPKTNSTPSINTTLTPPPRKVITKPPIILKNISTPIINTTLQPLPLSVVIKSPETLPKNTNNPKVNGTFSNVTRATPPPPPPPLPKDDEDDVDLLKRASRVNPYPIGGPKKVAFMFLTTTPLPLAPLWEKFFNQTGAKGKYNVYIHNDPRVNYNPPFTGVFSGRVIPNSKPTRRNTLTLVAAARRLLAHALLDDPNNYIFTLLSAACIPIHSFNFTYHTLTSSNKSFIEVLNNETTAYGRWIARGLHVMLPEIPFEEFRIGSQFWSITRNHGRVVVKEVGPIFYLQESSIQIVHNLC